MDDDNCPQIDVDEETYESKAIAAYLANEISAADLIESLGVSRAHTYRLIQRYQDAGEKGLVSKKYGKRNRARSDADREQIMRWVREYYADFGPTFAAEKLWKKHRLKISAETLRTWMKDEGLWKDRRSRQPKVFCPRKPRPRRGELVQIDGSYHRWFEKRGPECCLIVFIDDATSELKVLKFVEHETSYNYMLCLRDYILNFGCPQALFSDRDSIFRVANAKSEGSESNTVFAKACGKLRISIICAKTPQAKGRVERANRTLQDRLIKEMRLRKISTMESGNAFLEEYMSDHNKRFARQPEDECDAHNPAPNDDLDHLLTYTVQRKVFKDLSISFNKVRFILDNSEIARRAIGDQVTVALPLEGEIQILFQEIPLPYRTFDKIRRVGDNPEVVDHKQLGAAFELAKSIAGSEPHQFKRNKHVLAGFRKHFKEPDDPKSRALQAARPEVRKKHRGRSRAPLGRHPIVIVRRGRSSDPDPF